jgi:hypothetical protein
MRAIFPFVLAGAVLAPVAHADAPRIRAEQVQFKKGEAGSTLKGKIKGDEIVDYELRAAAGQSMVVLFKPGHPSAYFNVLPPGSDLAVFVGSSSGNRFEGYLPADGTYTIRVYLMRSAARRNESASYTLDVGLSGAATKAEAPPPSRPPPARYDASGHVKCSAGSGKLDQQCAFRVVRYLAKQSADVWIAKPASGTEPGWRFLHHEARVFTTDDETKVTWQREDDNWSVGVDGKEFYFIPDALIFGG